MEKSQKHVLFYARVSSAKQAQQGESIDDQIVVCQSLADRLGLNVLKIFTEQYSGRKDDRPVIEEIVDYIKKSPKKVDYLIFKSIDRFTRNGTSGYEALRERLAKNGVGLIDANGVIQPTTNTLAHLGVKYSWSEDRPSEITELVVAQGGKSEVNRILTRMIGAEIHLVRQGYKVRQPDDGYQNKRVFVDGKKKMVQIPDQKRAHYFIKMFEMSVIHTDQEIVDHLNAMGYRTKRFNQWSKSKDRIIGTKGGVKLTIKHLQEIRQRPIYCGINTEKWLTAPTKTQYTGLVSIELFNAANKGKRYIEEKKDGTIVIHKDYNLHQLKRMKNNPLFPHKAVVLCPMCKKPFLGSSPKGKSGKGVPTYHCCRKHRYYGVNKISFDKTLTEFISKLKYQNDDFMKSLEATLVNKYREKEKELGEFSVAVGTNVAELEAEKKQALDAFISTNNATIRADLEKKIDVLHAQIEQTRVQRDSIEVKENDVHDFVGYVKELMEHPVEMLVNQEDLEALKGLFSLVFDELPTYDEIVNGTPKLSLPYQWSKEFDQNKCLSVPPVGIEPASTP